MSQRFRNVRRLARPFGPSIFAVLMLTAALPALAQHPFEGHWEGEIEVPGTPLGVKVDLTRTDGRWSGTVDIPQQGATGLPLEAFEVAGEAIRFRIQGVPGEPTFDGRLEDGEIRGSFRQGAAELPFRLGREASLSAAPPERPQMPEPPFPYTVEEVRYSNGDVELAASLTLPPGEGPFPAVVLLTGSGPQDRDETLLGHKPFLVLADHLSRAGVAVLRADDRGVGGSTGSLWESTSADFAEDALAAVRFLGQRPKVDGDRIGLLGHSEGGLVAPLAAVRDDRVAFVILLAGPGVPGLEVVLHQTALMSQARGLDSARIEAQRTALRRAFDLMLVGRDEAAVREALAALPEVGEGVMRMFLSRWFRWFSTYDPAAALRLLKVPVLALNGERDLQVDPAQNLPPIRAALEAGGNPDVTVREMEGLNHLFQHSETGSPLEYASIEETLAPELLAAVTEWILERFGPDTLR